MIHSSSRSQRQQQINDFINLLVIRLAPGEPLPPLRRLMDDSGFGQVMLRNGIRLFLEQGLLEARPRQGIFRTGIQSRAFREHRVIDIVACSDGGYMSVDGFTVRLIQFLFQNGTERGYSMRIHRVPYESSITGYSELVRKHAMEYAFLVAPSNPEIARYIREQGVASVELMPSNPSGRGPAVVDSPDMINLQLDYLFAEGHSRIAMLHENRAEFPAMVQLQRCECFYRRMAEAGLRVPPEYVACTGSGGIGLQRTLEKMFRLAAPPTAIICNDLWLPQLYTFFATRRMVIGRDISILSDGESSRLNPVPTMVRNSQEEMARLGWTLMERLLAREPEERVLFQNLVLTAGGSVAALTSGRTPAP